MTMVTPICFVIKRQPLHLTFQYPCTLMWVRYERGNGLLYSLQNTDTVVYYYEHCNITDDMSRGQLLKMYLLTATTYYFIKSKIYQ